MICASRTVDMPRFVKRTNKSIKEIPVTISAFKSGILVAPSMIALPFFRMALMPIAAMVPMIVDTSAEISVMESVV